MDAIEYKNAKIESNALRRDTFETILRTVANQDPGLASRITSEATIAQLKAPPRHAGAPHSRWITVSMPELLADDILDILMIAEAGAVGTDGSSTAAASAMADLVNAWQHWLEHHEA